MRHPAHAPPPRGHDLPTTTTQRLLHGLAALVACVGVALAAWSVATALDAPRSGSRTMLLVLLPIAAIACSRVPLRLGVRSSIISLDSIPLTLAALLLAPHDAALVGVVVVGAVLLGQPLLVPGVRGWFWRLQGATAAGVAMAAASWWAGLFAGDARIATVLFVPALLTAAVLEALFDAFVLIELEATDPGSGRQLLDAAVVPMANVLLPSI
ncbi:MAG: hypothetical protein JWM98_157, partial [Thermoleophilia bacterium]|nr:hypothetical protein [Thermoleophilia bacterium]